MPATGTEGLYDPNAPRLTTGPAGAIGGDPVASGNTYNPWATMVSSTYQQPQEQTNPWSTMVNTTYQQPVAPAPATQNTQTIDNGVSSVGYDPSFVGQTVGMGGRTYKSVLLPNGQLGWQVQDGGGGPSESDLNAIYDPLMKSLNDQAADWNAQKPSAINRIESDYSQGIAGLNSQGAEAYGKLDTQAQQAQKDQATAYARARQLYGELQQRNQSMFGGRSSAGQFAGELLGRETAKQMGETTNQGTAARQAIDTERNRVSKWVSDQTNTWNQKKQSALDDLENSFRQGLLQINTQKGQIESAKASARLDLLNQAKAQVAQIQAADRSFQQQLALFQAQKESQLSAGAGANLGQDTYSGNRISTAPLFANSQGVGVAGESGGFSQSLRYVNLGNGYVQDKLTGEKIPTSRFAQ